MRQRPSRSATRVGHAPRQPTPNSLRTMATTTRQELNWLRHAACRGHDGEMWFPIGTSGAALIDTEHALAVCRTCPVIVQCLAYALDHGLGYGIWGGMTENQRRTLRRRNREQQEVG